MLRWFYGAEYRSFTQAVTVEAPWRFKFCGRNPVHNKILDADRKDGSPVNAGCLIGGICVPNARSDWTAVGVYFFGSNILETD